MLCAGPPPSSESGSGSSRFSLPAMSHVRCMPGLFNTVRDDNVHEPDDGPKLHSNESDPPKHTNITLLGQPQTLQPQARTTPNSTVLPTQ